MLFGLRLEMTIDMLPETVLTTVGFRTMETLVQPLPGVGRFVISEQTRISEQHPTFDAHVLFGWHNRTGLMSI